MSKELADSIVLAARKMEEKEVDEISIIYHRVNVKYGAGYIIKHPEVNHFDSFESAFNYLSMKGYHKVNCNRDIIEPLKDCQLRDGKSDIAVLAMCKKVKK